MAEVTLEAIVNRLEALERQVAEQAAAAPPKKDWRRVAGMFTGSEFMKQVDMEGQSIREADRQASQAGSAE
jgi:hypothetical protein